MSMKEFSPGERIRAADFNDNFSFIASALDDLDEAVDNAGAEFSSSGSDAVAVDMSKDRVITRNASGTVTFSGSNYVAGKSASVRVVAGGANRSLSFPNGWRFVSFKPGSIASGKVGVLALTCFGDSESDVVAAWAAEA